MCNKKATLVFFILLINFSYAQVGVGTTAPTKDLDINGELRIRNVPYATSSGNAILSVDTSGNVSKLRSPSLLIDSKSSFPVVTLSSVNSSLAVQYDAFSFTLDQDALVSINCGASITDMLHADGSSIDDGNPKRYVLLLYYKLSTDATYTPLNSDARSFTSTVSGNTNGIYNTKIYEYLQLTSGTYDVLIGRQVSSHASDSNGFMATFDGNGTGNLLQVIAHYN